MPSCYYFFQFNARKQNISIVEISTAKLHCIESFIFLLSNTIFEQK
jgi:hypothetical protein